MSEIEPSQESQAEDEVEHLSMKETLNSMRKTALSVLFAVALVVACGMAFSYAPWLFAIAVSS